MFSFAFLLVGSIGIRAASFQRIEDTPGLPAPHPYAISANGRTVIGQYAPGVPFIWRGGAPRRFIPVAGVLDTYAQSISRNGGVIVGRAKGAYRWVNGKAEAIKPLPGDIDSFAYGVSDDGRTVVGFSESGKGTRGFLWRKGQGIRPLHYPKAKSTFATAVSGDGKTVVGFFVREQATRAFVATTGDPEVLKLPESHTDSAAYSVSQDGRVIVGTATRDDGVTVPCVWRSGEFAPLQNLGARVAEVRGVTADGSFMVGTAGERAVIWNSGGEAAYLSDLLKKASVSTGGIDLESVNGAARVGNTLYLTGWGHIGRKDAGWVCTLRVL